MHTKDPIHYQLSIFCGESGLREKEKRLRIITSVRHPSVQAESQLKPSFIQGVNIDIRDTLRTRDKGHTPYFSCDFSEKEEMKVPSPKGSADEGHDGKFS